MKTRRARCPACLLVLELPPEAREEGCDYYPEHEAPESGEECSVGGLICACRRVSKVKGRIRTVKPSFFQHGGLYDLEEASGLPGHRLPLRLAYEGLWLWSDREGRFEWKPRELKLNILPYDPVDMAEVLQWLERGGFIVRYEVDGRVYGWVCTFKKHQRPHHTEAESDIPEPPEAVKVAVAAGNLAGGFHSYRDTTVGPPTAHGESTVDNRTEGNRIEGKGIEANGIEGPLVSESEPGVEVVQLAPLPLLAVPPKTRPLPAIHGPRNGAAIIGRLQSVVAEIADGVRDALTKEQELALKAEMVFAYWQAVHSHPKALYDDTRERIITRELKKNGGDVSELFYTVDGAKRDKAIQGDLREGSGKYDGIETIFRNRGQVERLANQCGGYRNGNQHPKVQKYAAAFAGNEETAAKEAERSNGEVGP